MTCFQRLVANILLNFYTFETVQLKVLLLTDGIFPYVVGGMQRHSFFLAKLLISKGVKVVLYHAFPNGSDLNDQKLIELLGEGDYKIRSFEFPSLDPLPGHYLRENFQLSKEFFDAYLEEQVEFDLIYAKGFSGHAFLKNKIETPVFVNFHGYEMFRKAASLKSKAEQLLLRKSVKWMSRNADIAVSYGGEINDILDELGIPKSRQLEFPSGISRKWVSDQPSENQEKRTFVFVGRFERRKGVQELTRSLKRLIETPLNFKFQFIGPIPKEHQLGDPRISYHGSIHQPEKIMEILRSSDVLVTPSYSEGMPNVILEAMSQGLAVIATKVGAVPKMVDEKNGWLISPGNTKELYAALLDALSKDDQSLSKLKASSLNRLKSEFIWEDLIDKLIDIFKERVGFEQVENQAV